MARKTPKQRRNSLPPEVWEPGHRAARALASPVQRFLAVEAASGILLMIAAVVALVWANSPWHHSYEELWHLPLGIQFGEWSFSRSLHFWINDGLMTIFFLVVGLEIRREIFEGSLQSMQHAALPLAAAIGGMLIPAGLYVALTHGTAGAAGWAIPMATDIAFAVGVLTLLGSRVPENLRILLLAIAVIDDIGAIAVIAVFYSGGLVPIGELVALGGLAALFAMRGLGAREPLAFVLPSIVLWAGLYVAGIHPTLAGVVVGMITPALSWGDPSDFATFAKGQLRELETIDKHELLHRFDAIQEAQREAVSPVDRMIHRLHNLVAFVVMPLFALANAGVALGGADLSGDGLWVFVGVVVGLAVGKPLGVVGATLLASGTGLATRPADLTTRQLKLVGAVSGIGFTMSLFIAQLAFTDAGLLETAKLGVLVGSAVAMAVGLGYGVWAMPRQSADDNLAASA